MFEYESTGGGGGSANENKTHYFIIFIIIYFIIHILLIDYRIELKHNAHNRVSADCLSHSVINANNSTQISNLDSGG